MESESESIFVAVESESESALIALESESNEMRGIGVGIGIEICEIFGLVPPLVDTFVRCSLNFLLPDGIENVMQE